MSDVKTCNKCNAVFPPDTIISGRPDWSSFIAHHNAHIRGELPALPPTAKKERLIDLKKDEDIRNVIIDEPAVPGAKPIVNAPLQPGLPQYMPPQVPQQPPIYYPPGYQPPPVYQPPYQQLPPQYIPPMPQPVTQPEQSKPIEDKAIVLKYVYEGTCVQDHSNVLTVENDIAGKHYVMAVCPVCQKQLEVREVENLYPVIKKEIKKEK